jgi:hypothetical protein
MTRQKVGLALFWIAVAWAILWGVIGSILIAAAYNSLTMEELNQTIWAFMGPLHMLWALGGVPLAVLVAGIGMLLYSGAEGSTILKYGTGMFLAVVLAQAIGAIGYVRPLFGLGGTLILLSFIGTIWLWAKERMTLKGASTTAADCRLLGYVFMVSAAWFICGMAGQPFMKVFEEAEPFVPLNIMALLVLGWIFFFLSHYFTQKQAGAQEIYDSV